MLTTWLKWAVRRPHLSVIPVAMLVLFVCLATVPMSGWRPRSSPSGPHLGTPPTLPDGPGKAPAPPQSRCDDLVGLEASALIGGLSADVVACLEAYFADALRQTDRKKISLLLIANANGKEDKRAWESLVQRHLAEVDQSDPDICYSYATHLARRGPGRAETVIRWSDVALENRSHWAGETYKSRVYGLYKLRAAAANTLFRRAEEQDDALQTDQTYRTAQRTQARLEAYSREWYVMAKQLGKNTATPLQLCLEVSQSLDFCEGE